MYQFTEDCLIGIADIDGEHRKLFQMINEAQKLLGESTTDATIAAKNLIKALREYAATHFAHEEAYMEKIQDPELARQKKEHRQFAIDMCRYEVNDMDEEQARKVMEELLVYLSRWLYRHIMGSDMMIGHNAPKTGDDAFAFTDKYRTGIELIDAEHQRLFEIIKETNDVIHAELLHDKYDEIVHILDALKDYTILHFQDEEAYMEEIKYEGLQAQKYAHAAFVDKLNEIDLEKVDDNQQEYLEELIDYLLDWLVTHILKVDKKIPAKKS